MHQPTFSLILPEWVDRFLTERGRAWSTEQEGMQLAIDLAQQNIQEQTGGPFGAAVFDSAGTLISVGINLVLSTRVSLWHAEMVALALAQKSLGTQDLSQKGDYVLVSSCEPCAMCLGAIPWSGIRRLICGASDADARAVGFDEGAKPENWHKALEQRSIRVQTGLLAEPARRVLQEYQRSGGIIY